MKTKLQWLEWLRVLRKTISDGKTREARGDVEHAYYELEAEIESDQLNGGFKNERVQHGGG